MNDINLNITKNISFHFGGEGMFYLLPTIAFSSLDWEPITDEKKIGYLSVIKWLNWSAGFNMRLKK